MQTQTVTCQQVKGCEAAVQFTARRSQAGEAERFCLHHFWAEMIQVPLWGAQAWEGGRAQRALEREFRRDIYGGSGSVLPGGVGNVRAHIDWQGEVRGVEVW